MDINDRNIVTDMPERVPIAEPKGGRTQTNTTSVPFLKDIFSSDYRRPSWRTNAAGTGEKSVVATCVFVRKERHP
jgi:hypothetical protein